MNESNPDITNPDILNPDATIPRMERETANPLEALIDVESETAQKLARINGELEGKTAHYGGMTLRDIRIESDFNLIGTDDHGNRFVVPRKDLPNFVLQGK